MNYYYTKILINIFIIIISHRAIKMISMKIALFGWPDASGGLKKCRLQFGPCFSRDVSTLKRDGYVCFS